METQPQALLIVYQHPISCSWSSTRKKTDWWRKGKKGGEKERKSRMSLCCVQGGRITDWTVPLEWGNQLFKDQTDLKFSMTGCIIHQDGFISKKQSRLQGHSQELSSEGILLKHHPPPPLSILWSVDDSASAMFAPKPCKLQLLHDSFTIHFLCGFTCFCLEKKYKLDNSDP